MSGDDIPREAVDLIGQIVMANSDALAATNDRLHESEKRQTRDMALALIKFYEGVDLSRDVLSTPALDKACALVHPALFNAYRIVDEASS